MPHTPLINTHSDTAISNQSRSLNGPKASVSNAFFVVAVVPAYNEAECIADTVSQLLALEARAGVKLLSEVIVCDNASTDSTASLAKAAGARVVFEGRQGYGAACLAAIKFIQAGGLLPDAVVFYNADQSEPVNQLPAVIDPISNGADLCVGERRRQLAGAKSVLPQQRLGNWLVCGLIRAIWRVNCRDLGPLRAIRWQALQALNMSDRNYGWTVEMQCKAYNLGMRVVSVPVKAQQNATVSRISGSFRGVMGAASKMLGWVFYLAFIKWLSILTKPIYLVYKAEKNRS